MSKIQGNMLIHSGPEDEASEDGKETSAKENYKACEQESAGLGQRLNEQTSGAIAHRSYLEQKEEVVFKTKTKQSRNYNEKYGKNHCFANETDNTALRRRLPENGIRFMGMPKSSLSTGFQRKEASTKSMGKDL